MERLDKYYKLSIGLCACLFFIGKIKTFNLILNAFGVGDIRTIISTLLFCVIDIIIGIVVIINAAKCKNGKGILILACVNLIYWIPFIIAKDYYSAIQHIVFIVPFSLGAFLVFNSEKGNDTFFGFFRLIRPLFFILGTAYILFLCFADFGEAKIASIEGFSYGDVGYAFLPFFIVTTVSYVRERKKIDYLYMLFFLMIIIYSGTRSVLLCSVFAFVATFILYFFTVENKKKIFINSIIVAVSMVILYQFCVLVTPPGSRFNYVEGNYLREFKQVNIGTQIVWDVKNNKEATVNEVFIFNSVNNEYSYKITEKEIIEDVKKKTGKYIITKNEEQDKLLEEFTLYMGRNNLWSLAIDEFCKNPLLGNGVLYFQTKYDGTYPHNIILELLVDFGIVGLGIFLSLVFTLVTYIVINLKKGRLNLYFEMIIFLISYIPLHMLYASFYSNGILLFTMICMGYMCKKAMDEGTSDA